MENRYFEVGFETYCKICKYKDKAEKYDPCCECLDYGYNDESSKPMYWEARDDQRSN